MSQMNSTGVLCSLSEKFGTSENNGTGAGIDSECVRVKIFNGHQGEVNSCCISKDYHMLVTAADDSKLLIWNVTKQAVLCELKGHTGPVNCCVFTPDNKTIASASYDSTVRLWETTTADCIATLVGHTKSVESVCFSKDGTKLCSASWDKLLILWDAKTGTMLSKLSGHLDCVKCCSFAYESSLLGSGSWDGEVRVWRLDSSSDEGRKEISRWHLRRFEKVPSSEFRVAAMKKHSGNVQAIAFSMAGLMASGSWDRTVCLWNPFKAELLKKFLGHTGWVKAVNFSLNSIELVSNADDDTIRVWNVISGECTKILQAQTDVAHHCFFSSSGNLLASGTALMS